jgi:Phage integrase family
MDAPLIKKEACILLGCGLTWFDKMVRQKSRLRLQDRPRVQIHPNRHHCHGLDAGRSRAPARSVSEYQEWPVSELSSTSRWLGCPGQSAAPCRTLFRRPDGLPYARKADGGGQFKTGFGCACRRAGLSGVTPHTLRHTWASWHYQQHRDLRKLMDLGGWNSLAMVVRYSHVNADEHADSINNLPAIQIPHRSGFRKVKLHQCLITVCLQTCQGWGRGFESHRPLQIGQRLTAIPSASSQAPPQFNP